jgi:hypothetical protein
MTPIQGLLVEHRHQAVRLDEEEEERKLKWEDTESTIYLNLLQPHKLRPTRRRKGKES